MGSINFKIHKDGDGEVEFFYPDYDNPPSLLVDLMTVRAAPPIKITYDFERDGWSITQAKCLYAAGTEETDNVLRPVGPEEWVEMAFIQSWELWETCTNSECPENHSRNEEERSDEVS